MRIRENCSDVIVTTSCPGKSCNGNLEDGPYTKECPVCGQIFLTAMLFSKEDHLQIGKENRNAQRKNVSESLSFKGGLS